MRSGVVMRGHLRSGSAGVVLLMLVASCTAPVPAPSGSPSPAGSTAAPGRPEPGRPATDGIETARLERDKPGSPGWQVMRIVDQHDVEGYTDRDSVRAGDRVRLFVSTTAGRFKVVAFRMGWYGGARGRAVWTSPWLRGVRQAPARVTGPVHRVDAPWRPSTTLETTGWPPGMYLLRLDTDRGAVRRFVPLVVRTASARGAVVLVNANTTWQAYNHWGGYSLYRGPTGGDGDRARAVTFDRPYDYGAGAGDFIGAELPLLALAERLGLPLAYATDVDLHRDPYLLDGARAVITLGHDEYWSPAMRTHVTLARDRGTNVAFLGANAIYRKIRFAATPLGAHRQQISYKDASDPILDPAQVTTQWRASPSNDPESALTGALYQCNPVRADMIVTEVGHWLVAGLNLTPGTRLPGLVGSEYDRVDLSAPTPRPIEVVAHSPVTCQGQPDHSDLAYYTTPSGAGVINVGTSDWIAALGSRDADIRRIVRGITTTLLTTFAAGPAGRTHPARDNTTKYYPAHR
jgi:hypothetical protein